jgi:hypothetical protein
MHAPSWQPDLLGEGYRQHVIELARIRTAKAQSPPCWFGASVTRQALLLDVKEALVDEFVDAEGA